MINTIIIILIIIIIIIIININIIRGGMLQNMPATSIQ